MPQSKNKAAKREINFSTTPYKKVGGKKVPVMLGNKTATCRAILSYIRDESGATKEYHSKGLPMDVDEHRHKIYLMDIGKAKGCMEKPFFKQAVKKY